MQNENDLTAAPVMPFISVNSFREALASLDRVGADSIFRQALKTLTPIQAVEQVVVPALEQIGVAWEAGNVSLSQVYMSGRFCEELVESVLPDYKERERLLRR